MRSADEQYIIERLRNSDAEALKLIFDSFYASLCHYANGILRNHDQAEEVVQDLFVRIWERRSALLISGSLRNYLFRAVRNQCLNLLEHEKVRHAYAEKAREAMADDTEPGSLYPGEELSIAIEKCIEALPGRRREIFRLSREEGFKYHEIAAAMNISVKTVEVQMGKALKTLRDSLRKFLL